MRKFMVHNATSVEYDATGAVVVKTVSDTQVTIMGDIQNVGVEQPAGEIPGFLVTVFCEDGDHQ